MEKANRNVGVVFLAIALLLSSVSSFPYRDGKILVPMLLWTFAVVFGLGAILYLQRPNGEMSKTSFDLAELKKGRVYTLLSETFLRENWWLVVIRMPDKSGFAFYSQRALKFMLGDKTQFSVIEGGRIIPLGEDVSKTPIPANSNPTLSHVPATSP